MPGFHDHSFECLVELCSFLSARYPSVFTATRCEYQAENFDTWGDSISGKEAGKVTGVRNLATAEQFVWEKECEREGDDWNPMRIAGCEL